MITAAFGIFFAFWLLWLKLPMKTKLILLGHPFALDFGLSALVFIMFNGSVQGALAATIAGLMLSIAINITRKAIGYIGKKNGVRGYFVGRINVYDKIRTS